MTPGAAQSSFGAIVLLRPTHVVYERPMSPSTPLPPAREALLQAVREVFADAEALPSAPRIVPSYDDPYFAELEARVAARPEPVDDAFLIYFAHRAHRFTDEAARWFWRALLTAAITTPWPGDLDGRSPRSSSLLHTTLYVLRPNPCARRYGYPPHEDGAALRAWMRPAERVVVSRLLGHAVTCEGLRRTRYDYLAAQGILWAWSDDPESLAVAQALHRDARTYVPQARDNPEDDALIGYIEEAFAMTPPPEGELMRSSWEEESEYALELAGTDWRDLATWFLGSVSSAYSFMTGAAFRYYLPAALRGYLEGAEVDPTFHLVRAVVEPSSFRDDARRTAAEFTPGERDAVAAFLRHVLPYEDDVATALAEVWEAPTA